MSNLKKDFGVFGLPVDDSQGRSKEQKVKIVTGLILRLQTEASSGSLDRPLGQSFCGLIKKSESSIAEGVQQLLDEVNGHFATEPTTGTKEASHAGDGNKIVAEDHGSPEFSGLPARQPDLAYQPVNLPSSSFAMADPAPTPLAPPPSYDALSAETGTKLAYLSAHMDRLMADQWGDDQITECRNQMQWIKGELNNLKPLGLQHFPGKFREVSKQFEELQVKDFHHRLDELEVKLAGVNMGSSKDIQSIERDIAQLSKRFDDFELAGYEERSRLVERQKALSNQLDEVKRHLMIHNDIKSLDTDLKDFEHRDLPDSDQIIKFFNDIEGRLSKIGTMIDSLPARSQRTELLKKKSQLRNSLNTSKATVKRQKLENIEQLIKTQEHNNEKGAALKEDMLEQAEDQLHDLKRLMNSLKMEEHESGRLQVLKGRLAKLNLTNVGEPVSLSKAKSSNTGLAGDIIENLDAADALITASEKDPYGFNEERASEAKGYLDKAIAQCGKIRDNKAQLNDLTDTHRDLCHRLQKIEERKGEIVQEKVEKLFEKVRNAIDFFRGRPKEEIKKEVEEMKNLFDQARKELEGLSGSNYDTIRKGLRADFNDLQELLKPYKDNISDSQKATATNSEDKNKIDLLKKEFDDYWKEYGPRAKDLEEQVLKCDGPDHPIEQRKGKKMDLLKFYEESLETAKALRYKKLPGVIGCEKECLTLTGIINHMTTQIEVMKKGIDRLEQEKAKEKRSGCMQS
ncbi:hypothetical protein [Salinisphaera sp. G21_0]|uniref:hypothetical protein n=1 Tax=Salinisphaera sp. G21_0 TaxID=2821094 RepID=UPI001ADCB03C|nr:hypothetical protein [Salinisphaera sp. G21_0]MBO9481082.1 hypothetical protein [Salinisphaera sp. G21_0]